jgi:hypothetical protein
MTSSEILKPTSNFKVCLVDAFYLFKQKCGSGGIGQLGIDLRLSLAKCGELGVGEETSVDAMLHFRLT